MIIRSLSRRISHWKYATYAKGVICEDCPDIRDYGTLEVCTRAQLNGRGTSVDVVGIMRKSDVHVCIGIIEQICIIDNDHHFLTGRE
jgi:hypothetical protein